MVQCQRFEMTGRLLSNNADQGIKDQDEFPDFMTNKNYTRVSLWNLKIMIYIALCPSYCLSQCLV